MSKHTPGPWGYYTEPQPNGCPIVGSRGLMVAMLAHTINQDDQRDTAIANARLISAAPDLLAALKLLDEAFCADDYGTREGRNKGRAALVAARAAIAKAEGVKQ